MEHIVADDTLRDAYSKLYHIHKKNDSHRQRDIERVLDSIPIPGDRDPRFKMVHYLHKIASNHNTWTSMRRMYAADWHACLCTGPTCDRCTKELGLHCLPKPHVLLEAIYKNTVKFVT